MYIGDNTVVETDRNKPTETDRIKTSRMETAKQAEHKPMESHRTKQAKPAGCKPMKTEGQLTQYQGRRKPAVMRAINVQETNVIFHLTSVGMVVY